MSREDFNTDSEYRMQLFKELIEIVGELGWAISFPSGEADEEVPYMIIGQKKNVDKVVEKIDGKADKAKTRS